MIDSTKFTDLLKRMTGMSVQYNEEKLQYLIGDGFASVIEGCEFIHIIVAANVGRHEGWRTSKDPLTKSAKSRRLSSIKNKKRLMEDLKILSQACRHT